MDKRKKGFYDHLVDWSGKIAMALCGCNGNELLVHILLKMRFIKHKMQVRVDMPEIARNSKYIIVDFVIPNHKGQEIWIEYDGAHHDTMGCYSTKQSDFDKQQRRDRVQEEYCKNNGIRLIRVRHSLNYIKTLWKLNKQL